MLNEFGSRTTFNKISDTYVVSVPNPMSLDALAILEKDLWSNLESDFAAHVIFDFSAVQILDSTEFKELYKQAKVIALMGVESFFVSVNPCVVAALVQTNIKIDSVTSCLCIQDALDLIQKNKNEAKA